MKNFQQNLLVAVVLGLCALCVWQWHGHTRQRGQIEQLTRAVYDKSAAIQGFTNSAANLDRQVALMDARLSALKEEAKTNFSLASSRLRELTRLQATNDLLTNRVAEYKLTVESLQAKLKEAYDGVQKQNASLNQLVAQRDAVVTKYNESISERNELIRKYNELVKRVEQLQGKAAKP